MAKVHQLRGAEKKEAFHRAAEANIHSFVFDASVVDVPDGRKAHIKLAGTDNCRASVQILRNGGDNNLHYHPNMDLIYMVLRGRIRFYGPEGKLLGECGELEGILLPENSRYWFESVGDEEAHLLQIAGFPKGMDAPRRIALAEPKQADGGEGVWYDLASGKTMSDAEHNELEKERTAR